MILALNIGNSSLRFGVFEGRNLKTGWILQTNPFKSADEYIIAINSMFIQQKLDPNQIDDIIIASVVPALTAAFRDAVQGLFGKAARFLDYKMNSGLTFPILPLSLTAN